MKTDRGHSTDKKKKEEGKKPVVKVILQLLLIVFVLVSCYFVIKLGNGRGVEGEEGIRLRYYILPFSLITGIAMVILGAGSFFTMFKPNGEKLSHHIIQQILLALLFFVGIITLLFGALNPIRAIPYLKTPAEVELVDEIQFETTVGEEGNMSYHLRGEDKEGEKYSFDLNSSHFSELSNQLGSEKKDYLVQYIPYLDVVMDIKVLE